MKRRSRASFTRILLVSMALAATHQASDAFSFTTMSPRILTNSRVSRALLSRRGSSARNDRTMLFSTAAPERVATSKARTRRGEKTASPQEEAEVIPNNMPDALNRFFFGPDHGPTCVVGMLAFMSAWRLSLAPVTPLDFASFAGMALFWCFQEHFIHEKLLHSDYDWMGKEIHENHHAKPFFNISIDPAWLMIAWLSTAHVLFRAALPLPLALSATLGYATFGLFYEWAHYIVHTRVKPPNAFWKRVRDNHIRHHLVDDRFWLSFTLPLVDDIFGTNPSVEEVKREHAQMRSGGSRMEPRPRRSVVE